MKKNNKAPRTLLLDVETLPLTVWTWGTFKQNISLGQIKEDWSIFSWSAKWLDEKEVFYDDNRKSKNVRDDKRLLRGIHKLLNECDVVITHYGNVFDLKKLNARFIINGMPPVTQPKKIDTKKMASKYFSFTSNKLEYLSKTLKLKNTKLAHSKFAGFSLWVECMNGNQEAWKELEAYNRMDVISLQELYEKLAPWDPSINFHVYNPDEEHVCSCGSKKFKRNGYKYTATGKFIRYKCLSCGKESRSGTNLLDAKIRRGLRR